MRELQVDSVRAVERAIQIMNCFSFERTELAIGDIIDKTKLAKATAYRLLWTLEQHGMIQYDAKQNTYRLGYKSLEYGGIVLENLDIRREAGPYLQQLSEQTGHSTVLAIPQGDWIQYLMRYDSDEDFQPRNFIGRRRILHNGAFGIVMLAFMEPELARDFLMRYPLEPLTPKTMTDKKSFEERLQQICRDGFYIDEGETFLGFTAIAAPIFDARDKVIAAAGMSGPSFKMEGESRDGLIRQTVLAAAKISMRMGHVFRN